ncbi:MAG: mitochondrial escape protein 2 [Trizodia sp. TS-e1964]|nr:MAG: mitochondrial escape protein 2 [Trizodia sp. TS-e1964]
MRAHALTQRWALCCQQIDRSCQRALPGIAYPRNPASRIYFRQLVGNVSGEHKSGHILPGPNEGILYFENTFPPKLNWIFRQQFISGLVKNIKGIETVTDPSGLISRAIPPSLPIKVTEILPRHAEGGAFVKFSHDKATSAIDIEATLQSFLKEQPIYPWFNPSRRVKAALVHGRPWLEDLYRLPNRCLRVEFVPPKPGDSAADLSQETLYALFRKYGKLANIEPQASDSKVLPRFTNIHFTKLRNAIVAKNCMHGFRLSPEDGGGPVGTVLRLAYAERTKSHLIRDWLLGHPRIVIPIVAALLAAITVAIFDPVRDFFIKAHITHSFDVSTSKAYRWFKSQAKEYLPNGLSVLKKHESQDVSLMAGLEDRRESIERMQGWLAESAETFIVVQGPRGSGKKSMTINQVLKGRKNVLLIDCKPIQEAGGDAAVVKAAATSVGYRPIFSWTNNISSLVDLAAQSTIGTKTGFSETLDTSLAKIWQKTTEAMRGIALDGRKKTDKDFNLSDEEYLETHPEKRPVVVIDNFLHKNDDGSVVYDKISEWAAKVTTGNIAHVIFLTTDVSFPKYLSKALPDRVFRQISLGDFPPEAAKRFILNQISSSIEGDEKRQATVGQRRDLGELDEVIESLGGRLTDLEFLARRLNTGETPKKAVKEIVDQSASEILKMFLLDKDSTSTSDRRWSIEQAWLLIKQLAEHETLRYNEVLLSKIYKTDGEGVLRALEATELIAITSNHERPSAIRPGRPVYQAAFRVLASDEVLRARLDLATLSLCIKEESTSIEKYESELQLLGTLPGRPVEVGARVFWLLRKLGAAQLKVEEYEEESERLKEVLKREY